MSDASFLNHLQDPDLEGEEMDPPHQLGDKGDAPNPETLFAGGYALETRHLSHAIRQSTQCR